MRFVHIGRCGTGGAMSKEMGLVLEAGMGNGLSATACPLA